MVAGAVAGGGPGWARELLARAAKEEGFLSDGVSVSTGGEDEVAPGLSDSGAALLEAVAARGAPVATAVGIILHQKTQHTWKEEGAPPGHARFVVDPSYEEMWDEDGGVDLLPRRRPEYMDKYEVRSCLCVSCSALLMVDGWVGGWVEVGRLHMYDERTRRRASQSNHQHPNTTHTHTNRSAPATARPSARAGSCSPS